MAQHASDISGGNPLSLLVGSSYTLSLVSSPSVIGGQSLQIVTSSGFYGGEFSAVPGFNVNALAATDFEVLILVRVASVLNGKISVVVMGTGGTFECYAARGGDFVSIVNGDTTTSSDLGFDIADGGWYWMRFRKRSGTLHAQLWAYGDAEPSSEAHSAALAATIISSSGEVVWNASNTSGSGSGTYNLDFISVGTAGDPAPRSKKTDLYVRDGGIWKPVQDLSVRDGGIWKPVQQHHVRDSGTWKKVYGS